jgi:hypothetical protein
MGSEQKAAKDSRGVPTTILWILLIAILLITGKSSISALWLGLGTFGSLVAVYVFTFTRRGKKIWEGFDKLSNIQFGLVLMISVLVVLVALTTFQVGTGIVLSFSLGLFVAMGIAELVDSITK